MTTPSSDPPYGRAVSAGSTLKKPLSTNSNSDYGALHSSWTGGRAIAAKLGDEDYDEELSEKQHLNARGNGSSKTEEASSNYTIFHYLIYALINVIIAVPGLYGYASVIFNHPAFQPHMNALAKLVIFSSFIHQLAFILFSSLSFAIGTVQDAGLIFLSTMSNLIANRILDDGGTIDEVVSTTLIILPLGTATLGLVLILLGKFRLLDIVSYLPMPVIGGYLAFIGYFCLEAGVALCIGQSMTTVSDWVYLLEPHSLLLAAPGLLSALILTIISRKATNDAILPIAMVIIPASFYCVLIVFGISMEEARDNGWVGAEAPPVPVQDLFHLVDLSLVRWSLVIPCIGTWVGMVFVVSFASCLDIAAVSMDMGEPLDTNKEMVTVGTSNLMSGLLFGFTGSYIFSQTIFTYRTGCHSRYVGMFIMVAYICVVVSTVNVLQIAPLFFLGATLIFIGYDLLWEWLIEIREKIFLTEYIVLLVTFVAIQIIGMDFGILFGVLVAVVDHVASTTRVSSLERVSKRSRAVWKHEDWDVLNTYGYNMNDPKIITLNISGPVFFGSSQKLLQEISNEIGLSITDEELKKIAFASPHVSTPHSSVRRRRPQLTKQGNQLPKSRARPSYVILDLSQMHNLDASAASSCFLQLAKMCEKRGIFLCAAGVIPRVEWMLRSHSVAFDFEKEVEYKNALLSSGKNASADFESGKLVLFLTIFEALEFCERLLLKKTTKTLPHGQHSFMHSDLTGIISDVLQGDLSEDEKAAIEGFSSYCTEVAFIKGETIFYKNSNPDAFFIVQKGTVAIPRDKKGHHSVVSGAGAVKPTKSLSSSNLMGALEDDERLTNVESFHKGGGIFGYCDFLLGRNRTFDAVAADNGAVVAKFTKGDVDRMKTENHTLYEIVQKLLLHASLKDLANCTCHN